MLIFLDFQITAGHPVFKEGLLSAVGGMTGDTIFLHGLETNKET
jgi:hypothetical protein